MVRGGLKQKAPKKTTQGPKEGVQKAKVPPGLEVAAASDQNSLRNYGGGGGGQKGWGGEGGNQETIGIQ